MNCKIFLLTTAIVSGLGLAPSLIAPAHAGFEWNPLPARSPSSAGKNASKSDMDSAGGPLTPMPGDTANGAAVEPVMASDIMDNGNPVAPVTRTNMPGMKSIGSENDAMLPVPNETAGEAMPAPTQTVEGFGKDIPLATALHQIVPSSYMIAYDGGVDSGRAVSWKGGKAWNKVMGDMLRSKKLHAEMSGGNTIRISKGSGPDIAAPSAQPASMASSGMNDTMASMTGASANGRPVLNMSLQKHWSAPAGQSLKDTLADWSGQAKVELAWQNINDRPLKSAFSFDGSYDQAVDALLSLYSGGNSEPHGKLYPNLPDGPSVLVIGSN